MEKEQEKEWMQAQNIEVSVDLIEAAKNQLEFLAVVNRNRHLYDGPALERVIYRYNAFWLPLLAKHSENPISDEPLVVPLDCEWIWHCHRLNPVRYKLDCEGLFGKVLDNHNIISSVRATSKARTEELWNQMYPEEPYEFDFCRPLTLDDVEKDTRSEKFTSYDLVSAVKRQAPFYYQVSREHMSNDRFLEEALARYKGFLHIIRTNKKKSLKRFCVPTYDIDLIWHSHQLHPVSYCNDLYALIGQVLEHDDNDSDRSKGSKLNNGFLETTKQFEDTFGLRYWKAGAMNRGNNLTPVTQIPLPFTYGGKKVDGLEKCDNLIQFPEINSVEVALEFIKIKNLPDSHKGKVHVSFSKKQPDMLFNAKKTLTIQSESCEKQVAYFQCEPSGEFLFELISHLPSNIKSFKQLGSCSLSLQDFLVSGSQFYINKWIPVIPEHGILTTEPILLYVSVSFTPPTRAQQVFQLVQSRGLEGSCFFRLPKLGKGKYGKNWTYVVDDDGNDVLCLKIRDLSKGTKGTNPNVLKEVLYVKDLNETHTLAELKGNEWFIKGSDGSFKLSRTIETDGHLFELVGQRMVKLFAGRRLEYEPKQCEKKTGEEYYITAVEFSVDFPYGKAVALFDLKHGTLKVKEGWMILTGMIVAFILSDIMKIESNFTSPSIVEAKDVVINEDMENKNPDIFHSARCGGGGGGSCGGGKCGSMAAKCGGSCGSCGGGCRSMEAKCGGSCGGGGGKCGSMAAKCGGTCGGGGKCGSMVAKCGGSCGGGGKCGSTAAKCGGSCGGGGKCGRMAKNSA